MLTENRLKQLHELITGSTKEELIWINGYLNGLVSNEPALPQASHTNTATRKITLAFGTETGNAKRLATQLAASAKKRGINARLIGLDQYRLDDIVKEDFFFVIISTQGEGEPPIPARNFYDHIHTHSLSLPNLNYSVLALGDTAYPLFCKTGEDVDIRFEKFGGKRIVPLRKCDVDYDDDAREWFEQILKAVVTASTPAQSTMPPAAVSKKPAGRKFYHGNIITSINLNDRGSNKETYHIEIGADERIDYEPGDTIGIIPRNSAPVVNRILQLTGADASHVVETAKVTATVGTLLTEHLNICYLLTSTVKKYAAVIGQQIPDTRMDLVDLLRIYPVRDAYQFYEIVKLLMPVAPRLYSIASSHAAHGENEVHITVAKDRFLAQDEQRFGLCSEFLGDLPHGSVINFYVHRDKSFKLPASDKDVIMIGPGTGIAPFRSFLSHRDATGATGRNWFFFGEQHFVTDFLYQVEMQNYVQTGVLTKIDLAFSRDQPSKLYVQHKMMEQAKDLLEWIERGASVFISGTKDPMSIDVEKMLLQIFEEHGGKTHAGAKEYLEQMKKENRFEKDVY